MLDRVPLVGAGWQVANRKGGLSSSASFCSSIFHSRTRYPLLPPPSAEIVRHLEAAILRLPFVERRAADSVLAADVGGLRADLLLPQSPDDLLFREPARLHVHPPAGDGLYPFLAKVRGSGEWCRDRIP